VAEQEPEQGEHGACHVLHQAPAPVQQVVQDGEALLSTRLNTGTKTDC
jgi:hypothetical protein